MNQTRKLLTLLAMVAFIVIIFTVGYNQWPHANLQIEFGRGRVWGLTPLGNALAILVVIYAGLFAILGDGGAFLKSGGAVLRRWLHALKRLGIGWILLCVIGGLVAIGVQNEQERTNAKLAKAARTDWQNMTEAMRQYIRSTPLDQYPPERRRVIEVIKRFVPEANDGWQKNAISARLRREPSDLTRAIPSPLPSGVVTTSPYATASDFANYAMKAREQALLKVEPQILIPNSSRPPVQRYPWKMNIVTTVFWIGEKGNYRSVWDPNWTTNYGGTDNPKPSARRNYIPIAFAPRQNPFYFALPYNDVTHGQFKPEAPLVIPWFKQSYTGAGQSVGRNRWIAIRKGNRLCYAQWEDCGPFRTDHFQYVFGNERPKPNANHGAGLNVSPAVRDYLGLAPTDVTDWQFVEVRDVPPGPWRSYGDNNHFVIARRQSEQRVRVADEWEKGKQPQPQPTATSTP